MQCFPMKQIGHSVYSPLSATTSTTSVSLPNKSRPPPFGCVQPDDSDDKLLFNCDELVVFMIFELFSVIFSAPNWYIELKAECKSVPPTKAATRLAVQEAYIGKLPPCLAPPGHIRTRSAFNSPG
ncbi:hypothetical protein E2C01_061869 [Portunus trituberculatus]|uniref:Uncharacterized protein n=1 Tax=Portunus trituberculatus TaxID=210409 RepID=A0A5B7H6F6_PORTR|nr:hypothetical protein [Portunus trituberculatus]